MIKLCGLGGEKARDAGKGYGTTPWGNTIWRFFMNAELEDVLF